MFGSVSILNSAQDICTVVLKVHGLQHTHVLCLPGNMYIYIHIYIYICIYIYIWAQVTVGLILI